MLYWYQNPFTIEYGIFDSSPVLTFNNKIKSGKKLQNTATQHQGLAAGEGGVRGKLDVQSPMKGTGGRTRGLPPPYRGLGVMYRANLVPKAPGVLVPDLFARIKPLNNILIRSQAPTVLRELTAIRRLSGHGGNCMGARTTPKDSTARVSLRLHPPPPSA